jgi:hypothetical protein
MFNIFKRRETVKSDWIALNAARRDLYPEYPELVITGQTPPDKAVANMVTLVTMMLRDIERLRNAVDIR